MHRITLAIIGVCFVAVLALAGCACAYPFNACTDIAPAAVGLPEPTSEPPSPYPAP